MKRSSMSAFYKIFKHNIYNHARLLNNNWNYSRFKLKKDVYLLL